MQMRRLVSFEVSDWLATKISTKLWRSAVCLSLFFVHEYPVNGGDKNSKKRRATAAETVIIVILKQLTTWRRGCGVLFRSQTA